MEFGMSRMGKVNYRESNRSPFLAAASGESYGREHSEQTAREIDQEVKRLIDEAIQKTRTILGERRGARARGRCGRNVGTGNAAGDGQIAQALGR